MSEALPGFHEHMDEAERQSASHRPETYSSGSQFAAARVIRGRDRVASIIGSRSGRLTVPRRYPERTSLRSPYFNNQLERIRLEYSDRPMRGGIPCSAMAPRFTSVFAKIRICWRGRSLTPCPAYIPQLLLPFLLPAHSSCVPSGSGMCGSSFRYSSSTSLPSAFKACLIF